MGVDRLLPTTVVGSYPQPEWLVDRDALRHRRVPRIHAPELWRVPAPLLEQAQDDATVLAIRDMERAGIDIVTDGEIRRESYSNRFALSLDGIDADRPAEVEGRTGTTLVPRVVGKIRRTRPVEVRDMQFLRANTDRAAKITLPGPFTMGQQVKDEHYKDAEAMCMDYAAAVNQEAHELVKAGADVIQLDEPWLRNNPEEAKRYAVKVINRALEGIDGTTVVHLCFGYAAIVHNRPTTGYSFLPELRECACRQVSVETAQPNLDCSVLAKLDNKKILLGVIDLDDPNVETAETVASRIRRALPFVAAENIIVAPDCGMKYLPRDTAIGKMRAMVEGAKILRRELGS